LVDSHPVNWPPEHALGLERLQPGRRYRVEGAKAAADSAKSLEEVAAPLSAVG